VGLGHGRAIQAMRALGVGNLGAVCNLEWAHPHDDTPASVAAAARYDAIYNRWFLGGFCKGEYPALALEGLEPHLPAGWQDDMATVSAPLDWMGLNYYTCKRVADDRSTPWPHYAEKEGPLPKTQVGWEIYPQGISDLLRRAHAEYTQGLPIYITENGMANNDILTGNRVEDEVRISYLSQHLNEVRAAIAEGVPVQGYFTWSLMDNYEWTHGYEKRFGIVHVDFDTLERTPKASYHAMAAALAR
jgi:beta-glucosidase